MKSMWWVVLMVAACSGGGDKQAAKQPELTQRQKDSVIGASRLPGAQGVRRALQVADSAAARRAREAAIEP
jgi:hypothetical protein